MCDAFHSRNLGLLDFTFIFEKQAQTVYYVCTHSPLFLKLSNFLRYATDGLEGMWKDVNWPIFVKNRENPCNKWLIMPGTLVPFELVTFAIQIFSDNSSSATFLFAEFRLALSDVFLSNVACVPISTSPETYWLLDFYILLKLFEYWKFFSPP